MFKNFNFFFSSALFLIWNADSGCGSRRPKSCGFMRMRMRMRMRIRNTEINHVCNQVTCVYLLSPPSAVIWNNGSTKSYGLFPIEHRLPICSCFNDLNSESVRGRNVVLNCIGWCPSALRIIVLFLIRGLHI